MLRPCLVLILLAAPAPAADFNADIRPLFAKHCVGCHGPAKQKGGLRLDRRADALKGGDSGPAIVPKKSADSLLVKLVSGDGDTPMPPTGPRLTDTQIASLKAWIDAGADWPADGSQSTNPLDWWSFRPLKQPAVPQVAGWGRTPIDAFVRAKHREQKLSPNPEADKRTLLRRLTFDMTGLPPTPEEVTAFLADQSPDAYEKLVDRLLASPAYGERWARHWLDVAHYADTHGYDKDQPRPHAWPYRDYVIRSLNADTPFDRFAREQIAGDALGDRNIEALGFLAAGPWDFIGHVEVPETKIDGKVARHLDRDDFVTTTVQTFLSLTVGCAQCHNHKFDPITQEDYYSLHAVFAAIDRTDRPYDRDLATARKRQELAAAIDKLKAERSTIESAAGPRLAEIDKLLAKPTSAVRPPEHGYHSALSATADTAKWVQVDLGRSVPLAAVTLHPCSDDFGGIGDGFGFPVRFKVEAADDPTFEKPVTIADRTTADLPNPKLAAAVFKTAVTARYVRVTATKLAHRVDTHILALAELTVTDATGTNLSAGRPVTAADSIEAPTRWAKANLTDGRFPTTTDRTALWTERAERLRVLSAELRGKLGAIETDLKRRQDESAKLPSQGRVYCGAVHTGSGSFVGTGANDGKPRPIAILPRGDVTKPGKPVGPGAITAFAHRPPRFDLPKGHPESARRAALAAWVTDRDNPLFWRSIVNRVWRYHMGRGLSDTPSDFGKMGQTPSHPELLDWLAVWFRDEAKGSLKQLHKLIVTSAVYRQSSATNAAFAKQDADNVYLWRANRRKLEAEAVRDAMLAAAGVLDRTMYGPGFQDFVVERPEHSPHYQYHRFDPADKRAYRRSVYRFVVRSKTQPFLTALDCADPSAAVEKRNESVTPLQSLALLNNAFVLAASGHLAARAKDVPTAVRLALGREPTTVEAEALTAYAKEHGLPAACRVLFNLNEFAFVD